MILLNGKELANKVKDELREEVSKMKQESRDLCLAVIKVGSDPASSVYVNNKKKACEYIGIKSEIYHLDDTDPEFAVRNALYNLIDTLNNNNGIHGILVQLPLPKFIDEREVLSRIDPAKDVDGFHESNVGKLMNGADTFVPCTAKGVIELLKENDIQIEGKRCVIVGRSNIVGKPVAMELLRENATVTICHSKTRDLKYICREADILICAIGKPKFFGREYIKPGTVVVDVGIHRTDEGLCGDVDYEDVCDIVDAITPVPGGVGPMTVAMLMRNTVEAAKKKG